MSLWRGKHRRRWSTGWGVVAILATLALGSAHCCCAATEESSNSGAATVSKSASAAVEKTSAAAEDVAEMIGRLGDDEFAVRETATRQLMQCGISAKPQLVAALESGDAEVRNRARRALDVVLAADRKQRLRAFQADVDGSQQATLPGWAEFQKIAGGDRTARDIYVEMWQADSALLEAFHEQPQHAADMLRQRCAAALPTGINGARIGPSKLNVGSMLTMIFVASQSSVPLTDEATQSMMLIPEFLEILGPRSVASGDPRRTLCGKVVGRWIEREKDAKYLPAELLLAVRFNLQEGLPLAIQALQQPQALPRDKCNALKLIGKYGGPEQISLIEPLLHDAQPCFDSGGNHQPTQAQVRDFALVATIRLNGQDPKQFGLGSANWATGVEINPNLVAFPSERDRTAAFVKWQDWQKGQKQAAREKTAEAPNRE